MQYTSPDIDFNTTEKETTFLEQKQEGYWTTRGPGATSIWAKRMLSHDITEFYEVLNVDGTLISIYHCQGKISIVTRELLCGC